MSADEIWIDLSEAVMTLESAIGSAELGRQLLLSALVDGTIRSKSKYHALKRNEAPIASSPDEELPKDFWKFAKIDWSDLSKAINHPKIFVSGLNRRVLPYKDVYLVQINHADFVAKWPTPLSQAAGSSARSASNPSNKSVEQRRRGPRATQLRRVVNEMRSVPISDLQSMKEVAMETFFGASRDTCRKARNQILAEFDSQLRQTPTIDK